MIRLGRVSSLSHTHFLSHTLFYLTHSRSQAAWPSFASKTASSHIKSTRWVPTFMTCFPSRSHRPFDYLFLLILRPLGLYLFYFQIVCVVGGQTLINQQSNEEDQKRRRSVHAHSHTTFNSSQPLSCPTCPCFLLS